MAVPYGNYCGIGKYSSIGKQPIDKLDRACQIHDICTYAVGLTDCRCSDQLDDLTKIEDHRIDQGMINSVNALSKSFWMLDTSCTSNRDKYKPNTFYIGNLAGFQYIPFYTGVYFVYSEKPYGVLKFNEQIGKSLLDNKNVEYTVINPGWYVLDVNTPKCILNISQGVLELEIHEYIGLTELVKDQLLTLNIKKARAMINSNVSGAVRLALIRYTNGDSSSIAELQTLLTSKYKVYKNDYWSPLLSLLFIMVVCIIIIYTIYKIYQMSHMKKVNNAKSI